MILFNRLTVILVFMMLCVCGLGRLPAAQIDDVSIEAVQTCIDKGIAFFHSINTQGGYVYYVTVDLKQRWGESVADAETIEVQSPGTPAVGMTFLTAYRVTGKADHLNAARHAASALIRGQNALGGWDHTIRFNRPKARRVSFDDDQTQGAIRFLMALDQAIDDVPLTQAIDKALAMMIKAQLDHGGWPHMYPPGGSYHDYATFNDQGINDCIRVMMDAVRYYDESEYRESLNRVGRFLMISQLPPPQSGWAQQYNEYLQPAWARDFEPPAVCPAVTVNNLVTLMDLYDATHQTLYLKPIPGALRWLEQSRMPNGRWARFVEMGTGEALYYDRDRIRVDSMAQLHIERRTGYGYQTDLSNRIEQIQQRFDSIRHKEAGPARQHSEEASAQMISRVRAIINAQDEQGRWITRNDRYKRYINGVRWNGEYETQDRISSAVFNQNMRLLCAFLECQSK
ncbi:MAG: hypothetical protein HQ515_07165 [Phycisphaeraceae bacterium]|nr:hypothetical protein [Phycisphaeraceae bacterium]